MKNTIENIFNVQVSVRPPVIMKWRPGIEQRPHADKQLNDGRPNAFVNYDINSLFYYNDDFDGGELYYPQHEISVKPRPGLAVIHPGDVNYLHGVTMIEKGYRYTTPSFYTVEK
jgi:predicted 2-oxoglutarate/Fe(II)-dependent dioxygenase YbiX